MPSPDGRWLVFSVRETDLDANRGRTDLWLAATDGSSVTRLTTSPDNDTDPAWSHDGKWIYFLSSRGGSSQVWRISPTGGEAQAVTHIPADVGGFKLFPDGKRVLLAADVWPDAKTLADSAKRDEQKAKSKEKARDLRPAPLPPLGSVGGRQVLAPVRVDAAGGWRQGGRRTRCDAGRDDRHADASVRRHGRRRHLARRKIDRVHAARRRTRGRVDDEHRRVRGRRRWSRQAGRRDEREPGI